MPATDFLIEKHQEITSRLSELKPLVEEYQRLEQAAAALDGIPAASGASARTAAAIAPVAVPRRRGPGRPKRATAKPASKPAAKPAAKRVSKPAAKTPAAAKRRGPGRRKGSGERSAQALELVNAQPGITIPELAAKMGTKQNYLYRVTHALEQEQKLNKQGRRWYPHPNAPAAS